MSYTTPRYQVPSYVDVSHYRAHYKNYPISGFGAADTRFSASPSRAPSTRFRSYYHVWYPVPSGLGAVLQGTCSRQIVPNLTLQQKNAVVAGLCENPSSMGCPEDGIKVFVSATPMPTFNVGDAHLDPKSQMASWLNNHATQLSTQFCWSFGADTAPPSPEVVEPMEPPPGSELGYLIESKNGKHFWTSEGREAVMAALAGLRVVFIGGPTERVSLEPFSEDEIMILSGKGPGADMLRAQSAPAWVEQKVAEGKVVLAPVWVLAPIPGRELAALPASAKDAVAEASSTNQVAILAEPGFLARFGTAGMAVGAVAVLGVGVIGYKALKKRRVQPRPSYRFA